MKINNQKIYEDAFIKTFGVKKPVLKKLKYKSVNQWDSVGHMNLMGVLEKKFKIEMSMNDIIDFSSFEKGKKILKKYKIKF